MAGGAPARYWHRVDTERIGCDLCPRRCHLRDGQRGYCFVRRNTGGSMELTAYGRTSGFQMDPIEKKPLYHVAPGSRVLSFGTVGCNLRCRFCQNWELSTARAMEAMAGRATPTQIADAARAAGCLGVAYTYNDPIVFAEYAIDTAVACRDLGLANIAVTAGYIEPAPRRDLFAVMDAANIDLKAFTAGFYRRVTGGRLATVLETLEFAVHESPAWVEVTTLVIPGFNDSPREVRELTRWVAGHLGPDVPLHFSAFHPAARMRDVPPTPVATLNRARDIAREAGLRYVYLGNVHTDDGGTTLCPHCHGALVERRGYAIVGYRLTADGRCPDCATRIPGRWGEGSGGREWGAGW